MNFEHLTIETQYGRKALSYTQQFLRFAQGLKKEAYVLDLCCGYGRHALYLCEHGIPVMACDKDAAAIQNLHLYCTRFSCLDTDVCDMSELPYCDGTFDGVICYSALHHQRLNQLERTFSEVRRVCKKGGIFSFDILSRNDATCGVGRQIEPFTYIGGRDGEENVPHHYVDDIELQNLMRGFRNAHMREVTYQFELDHQQLTSTMFCVEAAVI